MPAGAFDRRMPPARAAVPARPTRPARSAPARRERGQSLVEFALVLGPMLLLLVAIVQFAFIFYSYVTLSAAVREASREASIYVYRIIDPSSGATLTQAQNDTRRNDLVRTTLTGAMNGLTIASPNFVTTGTWTTVSSTATTIVFRDGDVDVTYTLPSWVTNSDPRRGWRVAIKATYRQNLFVPFIPALLPQDAGGRLPLSAEMTMVIN